MTRSPSHTNGFLFADLRDYTAYVESQGDRAAVVLLEVYRDLVRTAVAGFGGAEIKTEGDSFYVVFPSASTAVEWAWRSLRRRPRSRGTACPSGSGSGVHAGETVETDEGFVGSAVNIAARVCSPGPCRRAPGDRHGSRPDPDASSSALHRPPRATSEGHPRAGGPVPRRAASRRRGGHGRLAAPGGSSVGCPPHQVSLGLRESPC